MGGLDYLFNLFKYGLPSFDTPRDIIGHIMEIAFIFLFLYVGIMAPYLYHLNKSLKKLVEIIEPVSTQKLGLPSLKDLA